jgi:hypothetical protein
VLLVAAIRTALWVVPFPRLQRLLHPNVRPRHSGQPEIPVNRFAWAVQAAARRIPGASCLTQSLALHWLLVRAGHASEIRIGAAKDAASGFQAHAWVEQGGCTWLSTPSETQRYVALTSWRSGRS